MLSLLPEVDPGLSDSKVQVDRRFQSLTPERLRLDFVNTVGQELIRDALSSLSLSFSQRILESLSRLLTIE